MKTFSATIFCCCVLTTSLQSQTDSSKIQPFGWKHVAVGALNLTQVSFSNWAQGGDNALAWATTLDGNSENNQEKTDWTNSYKLAFGQTKIGDNQIQKTDDKIDLETVLTYKIGAYVNPYAAATFKSQFAEGYMYIDTGKTAVSKFMDPGYITQSVGAGYQPFPELKTRLGTAVREIVTSQFNSYADNPATPRIEKTSIEGGLESSTDIVWTLADNLLFTSKIELFDAFTKFDQIIVHSDNTIAAKVSKYVSVNLNVQLINEKDVTPRTQVKQSLAMGLSYAIL